MSPIAISADTSTPDQVEDAIELPRNDKTDRTMPEKNHLTEINSDTDSRVYKIELGMNPTEKLTIVSQKTYDIVITDSNGNTIIQRNEIGEEGSRQVEFPTDNYGDYYLFITPSDDGRTQYPYSLRVIVGEPIYLYYGNEYQINLLNSSLTPTNTTSRIQYFDLSDIDSIPEGSILTGFTVGGTEVNRSSLSLYSIKRSLRPNSSLNWIDATYPLYSPSDLDVAPKSDQILVKQGWAFRHSADFYPGETATYTLTPKITLDYKIEMK